MSKSREAAGQSPGLDGDRPADDPVGVGPKDRLDVQVEVPPACGTTSLAGGYLLMTRLREVMIAGGCSATGGADIALAQGPVMIGTPAKPNDPKVGRVLGGGKVKKEHPYTLVIRENRRELPHFQDAGNGRQRAIPPDRGRPSERGGDGEDATLTSCSRFPRLYHQNQEHFFRVVQLLPMIDSPELRTPAHRGLEQGTARSQDRRHGGHEARGTRYRGHRTAQGGCQELQSAGPFLLRRVARLPQRYLGRGGTG